jgi:RimJ/RimL family protein N-acetyltransferase
VELRTDRLLLRRWRSSDIEPMGAINADAEVARYLNRPPPDGSFVAALESQWRLHGFGLWALESTEPATAGEMLGFAGLGHPSFIPALEFEVEIGWRLARSAWGRGLATEAARATLAYARDPLGLRRLISIIHPENVRSQRVAEKLGMAVGRLVHNPVLGIPVEVWELEV